VPFFGTDGFGFVDEVEDELAEGAGGDGVVGADVEDELSGEGCSGDLIDDGGDEDFEPMGGWPFRVCGLEEDAEAGDEGTGDQGRVKESKSLEVERGGAQSRGKETFASPLADEDESQRREARPDGDVETRGREDETPDEELRGPVRVPWMRYGDAPRRSKPGEDVEESKTQEVERSDEATARRSDVGRDEGERQFRVPSSELQEPSPRPLSQGERESTGGQAASGTLTGGTLASGTPPGSTAASGTPAGDARASGTGAGGNDVREDRIQAAIMGPTGGELPPEYYEPLLTEAELQALMSDEDIELRDDEREALLGKETEGTEGKGSY